MGIGHAGFESDGISRQKYNPMGIEHTDFESECKYGIQKLQNDLLACHVELFTYCMKTPIKNKHYTVKQFLIKHLPFLFILAGTSETHDISNKLNKQIISKINKKRYFISGLRSNAVVAIGAFPC